MNEDLLKQLRNTRVKYMKHLITPEEIREKIVATDQMGENVLESRKTITNIIHGGDKRVLGLVGPCSIHNVDSALEYAKKLNDLREEVKDTMYLAMRVYPEKPRTTIGWEGLIPEPDMDGHANYNKGLTLTRQLMCDISAMGLPITMEILGDRSIQYYDELLSHGSIGARTVESMPQRKVCTLLSMPLGLKNSTEGNIDIAVDAVETIIHGTQVPGMGDDGALVEIGSYGNPDLHVVLRGGNGQPNYHQDKVAYAATQLKRRGLPYRLMVDCSHANSSKDHNKQPEVLCSVIDQIIEARERGEDSPLMGYMLESNIKEGKQNLPKTRNSYTKSTLDPYQSITDACISWDRTESLIMEKHEKLAKLI
jgi:3-deoxy-7-phosphoheptulonate synthase